MRKFLVACVLGLATAISTTAVQAQSQAMVCNMPETGLIHANGSKDGNPTGPMLITFLRSEVDPAHPLMSQIVKRFIIDTKDNIWFPVDDFTGSLFLAKGDYLVGRSDFSAAITMYSGMRCNPEK